MLYMQQKRGPGHKCATTVQLHIVRELLDGMGFDSLEEVFADVVIVSKMCAISEPSMAGTKAPRTFWSEP
jgi:hypothetical protein